VSGLIKAYSREPWASRTNSGEGERYVSEKYSWRKPPVLFFPLNVHIHKPGLPRSSGSEVRLTILGDITTGDLVAFISYLTLLAWPMMATGWVAISFKGFGLYAPDPMQFSLNLTGYRSTGRRCAI